MVSSSDLGVTDKNASQLVSRKVEEDHVDIQIRVEIEGAKFLKIFVFG